MFFIIKVRKLDSDTLPPCSWVLLKKMRSSSYIARLWRNFLKANPQDQDVLPLGWRIRDGHYTYNDLMAMQHQKLLMLCVNVRVHYLKFEKFRKIPATDYILFFSFWFLQKSNITEEKFFEKGREKHVKLKETFCY